MKIIIATFDKAVLDYVDVSAQNASKYGVHHFEIGNELERAPHPKAAGIYNWHKVDKYYMRLLKLVKGALVDKFNELGRSEKPKVLSSRTFFY